MISDELFAQVQEMKEEVKEASSLKEIHAIIVRTAQACGYTVEFIMNEIFDRLKDNETLYDAVTNVLAVAIEQDF
jgi:glutathione peroxidase-family protein